MLTLPYTFKFYFYSQPVDMRKTFNGLHLLIMSDVEAKDFSGRMYIFLNKRRDKVKVFYWDNDGFAIWYKQLEKGLFEFPKSEQKYLELSSEILQQIFLGFNLKSLKKNFRFSLTSL